MCRLSKICASGATTVKGSESPDRSDNLDAAVLLEWPTIKSISGRAGTSDPGFKPMTGTDFSPMFRKKMGESYRKSVGDIASSCRWSSSESLRSTVGTGPLPCDSDSRQVTLRPCRKRFMRYTRMGFFVRPKRSNCRALAKWKLKFARSVRPRSRASMTCMRFLTGVILQVSTI